VEMQSSDSEGCVLYSIFNVICNFLAHLLTCDIIRVIM